MLGIPLGLLYSNAGEWLLHKYLLHGLGRRKGTFWAFHWHELIEGGKYASISDLAEALSLDGPSRPQHE